MRSYLLLDNKKGRIYAAYGVSNYSIKEGEFMSKITDYGFLFQQMFGTKGTKSTSAIGSFQLSQLNSSSIQSQLKAAGIDTNSAQYKAAIKQMMSNAHKYPEH